MKFASISGAVAHAGLRIQLHAGEAWADDDPLVVAYPDLFTDKPTVVRTTGPSGVVESPVEQATAAPGEKRTTTRRRA